MGIIGGASLAFEVSFPLNVYNNSTPTTNLNFNYTPPANGSFPLLSAPYLAPETGLFYTPQYGGSDRHVVGVNTDTCTYSEIYQLYQIGQNPYCLSCNSQSGVQYNGSSYALNQGPDAAGMYLQPLSMRYSELKAGAINHALRFTLSNGYLYSGEVWPATAFTNECNTLSTCLPYGTRLRMKAGTNCASLSTMGQAVCTALKTYGMFVADGGINGHIQTMADATMDLDAYNALNVEISNFHLSDFEAVDESALMESPTSGRVKPANGLVTPLDSVTVIATDSASHTATTAVAIQPVTIGTINRPWPSNAGLLATMAGAPQFQIPVIVNGTTNHGVTCTMNPNLGTLQNNCLYTPPAIEPGSTSSRSGTTMVTVTSQADANVSYSFPLYVYPSDGIRIDIGGESVFGGSYNSSKDYGPDANGDYWWVQNTFPWWYSKDDEGYPVANWGTSPDIALYYTRNHGTSDGAFGAIVPNGTYAVTLDFGIGGSFTPLQWSMSVDSQGTPVETTFDLCFLLGTCASYRPGTVTFIAAVTNNNFYVAVRQTRSGSYTTLSALSVIPVQLLDKRKTVGGTTLTRGRVR